MLDQYFIGVFLQMALLGILILGVLHGLFLLYTSHWVKHRLPDSRLKPWLFWIPLGSLGAWIRLALRLSQGSPKNLLAVLGVWIFTGLHGIHWIWLLGAWIFFPWGSEYYVGIFLISGIKLVGKIFLFFGLLGQGKGFTKNP